MGVTSQYEKILDFKNLIYRRHASESQQFETRAPQEQLHIQREWQLGLKSGRFNYSVYESFRISRFYFRCFTQQLRLGRLFLDGC
jgi:hypothetical protein